MLSPTTGRTRLLASTVVAAVLALTACAGGTEPSGAAGGQLVAWDAARLASIAGNTIDAATMAFDISIGLEGQAQTFEGGIEGRGAFASGDGEVISRYDGTEVRAIIQGDAFWFTSNEPAFVAAMPVGASWVRGTFEELGEGGVITPFQPPALLYLLAGATNVRAEPGEEGTISWTFDLDVAAAVQKAPADRRAEVSGLMWTTTGEVAATGRATTDGTFVRELVITGIVGAAGTTSDQAQMRWEATFDDIGEEVTVAPPVAQVVHLAEVPGIQELL